MQQTMLTAEQLVSQIVERGYAEFEHGISDDLMQFVIGTYLDFSRAHPDPSYETMDAMLPKGTDPALIGERLDELDRSQDTQLEWHKYRTNVPGIGKPDGYTNRSFQVLALAKMRGLELPKEDAKEFYHYSPQHNRGLEDLHAKFNWGKIPPEVIRLNQALAPMHRILSRHMIGACQKIAEVHPEINNHVSRDALLGSPIRLLSYHPPQADQLVTGQLAAGHYDKSLLTIQLAESHLGLRVATKKGEPLTTVVRSPQHAVLFAAHRLSGAPTERDPGGIVPDSALRPAWHDVVETSVPNEGRFVPSKSLDICARWSIIYFLNPTNFIQLDKTVMHQR